MIRQRNPRGTRSLVAILSTAGRFTDEWWPADVIISQHNVMAQITMMNRLSLFRARIAMTSSRIKPIRIKLGLERKNGKICYKKCNKILFNNFN